MLVAPQAAAALDDRLRRQATLATPEAFAAHAAAQRLPLDPGPAEALAARALDAAKATGAAYASARLTRTATQLFDVPGGGVRCTTEFVGFGVQVLVDGSWGFASSPVWTADEAARLARAAVAQARANAKAVMRGQPRVVDLGRYPAATGTWQTPVQVDPFAMTLEEKGDYIRYWQACAMRLGMGFDPLLSNVRLARQERVLATTEGTRLTQTVFETGATLELRSSSNMSGVPIEGLDDAGIGWELFLDPDIPARLPERLEAMEHKLRAGTMPARVGRYTVVCDGAAMAALLGATLGVATQLDRALGYEANASGTSYLDDPLTMVGQEKVASPLVTVMADRSMERGLATVKWDDEGVEPDTATLVKDGVLTDFQTTRESSAWLKEYYAKTGQPVRSHGYAAAGSALNAAIQHPPNLTLAPAAGGPTLEELVANVPDGLLVRGGTVMADFQARSGLFVPTVLQRIRSGRAESLVAGGAVLFNSMQIWKSITTLGDPASRGRFARTQYGALGVLFPPAMLYGKGEPPQLSSYTTEAPAALLTDLAIINPARKA